VNAQHAQRIYFEQIKRVVPLTAVLARYHIELKKVGTSLKGCCPIHKGSNSRQFVVDENKNLWRCFSPSCDRGGSIFEFVAEMEHSSTIDAARLIARWFAIGTSNSPSNHRNPKRRHTMSGKPTHKVYSAQKRGENEKDFLTRIGSAWPFETKDGRGGLNIALSAMPLGERMVIFEAGPDDEEGQPDKKGAVRKK